MKPRIYFLFSILATLCFISCKKAWLDAKPKQSLTIPATLNDFQVLLDNTLVFNADMPSLTEQGGQDYYLTETTYNSRSALERKIYSWAAGNIFEGESTVRDWGRDYQAVFYSNNVLEGLEKINMNEGNEFSWKNIKGTALFYRAYYFYDLAQLFCKVFDPASAATDLGIPLRLESDINIPSVRSTVRQTYDQIISDLMTANDLLPPNQSILTRPSKTAVFAMLARVYLSMSDYINAGRFADSCLAMNSALLDYKTLPTSSATPMPAVSGNPEIIFRSRMNHNSILAKYSTGNGYVDSTLFQYFNTPNDLRQNYFFEVVLGRRAFTGTYDGGSSLYLFNGLATDEVFLIRAECLARAGNTAAALRDLDSLLIKRWKAGTFTPSTAIDANDALNKILLERRKELCFRGIRWTDLRRLNLESRFATTIKHGLFGSSTIFTLSPNDNRYVYPIPDDEILYNNLPQNPR